LAWAARMQDKHLKPQAHYGNDSSHLSKAWHPGAPFLPYLSLLTKPNQANRQRGRELHRPAIRRVPSPASSSRYALDGQVGANSNLVTRLRVLWDWRRMVHTSCRALDRCRM